MSPARAQKTKARVRCKPSLGPRRGLLQSSSPPPPPPPVGLPSTGGLPPVPGAFRSISAGMGEKMDGIELPVTLRLLLLLFGRTQNRKRGLGNEKRRPARVKAGNRYTDCIRLTYLPENGLKTLTPKLAKSFT